MWTQSGEVIPVDYRVYHKENDDKTKNDHFHDMLQRAHQRGFTPRYVLMGAWYSSVSNLKLITKKLKWNFICNLKPNRKVSFSQETHIPSARLFLLVFQQDSSQLEEYGFILVSKIVDKNADITYLATNDLTLTDYDKFIEHFSIRDGRSKSFIEASSKQPW